MANSDWGNEFIAPPVSIETLVALKNAPLPDSVALIARPWLLAASQELARINDDIRELELGRNPLELGDMNDEIQRLELQRSAVLPSIEVYRVALAPHKILPVDGVREIFLCAARNTSPQANLNEVVNPYYVYPKRQIDIRLTLCSICSGWRSIALQTPELWNDVRVEMPTMRVLDVLEIWFSRSLQSPLNLEISGTDSGPRITQLLTDYSWRFRSLSIRPDNPLLYLPAGAMDCLETLEIDLSGFLEWPLAPITTLEDAPRLRSLALKRSRTVHFHFFRIPWHQLTELHLNETLSFPPSSYYPFLAQCKALVTARLTVLQFETDGPLPLADRNIALPRLQTLELDAGNLTEYAKFLHRFDLPSLEDLTLHTHKPAYNTTFHVTALPTVRHLYLDGGRARDPMLAAWLGACPSVVEVHLPDSGIEDFILDHIARGSLLPDVELITMLRANLVTLTDTLHARQRSLQHSTITEVALDRWTSAGDIDRLADLIAVGVFVASLPKGKRGEIKERARLDFEIGSGVFEPNSWMEEWCY
ncbi:hypothetical protein C8R44DRAFT_983986 [Mycena epipterygia]|nr:hypothetical protein C8R44DRAFT_983986 [Mycena epipterygia]